MKSFILVPLCVFITQFPLLYLLIMNYSIGVTDAFISSCLCILADNLQKETVVQQNIRP